MDINVNTLPYQSTVITPKLDNNKKPVDSLESTGASSVAQAKKPEYSEGELQQAVSKLNDFVQTTQKSLQFSVDKESGAMITKVIDSETDKVIWQMPTEDAIKLAHSLTTLINDGAVSIFSSKA
ncbi:flagellar protein FlaG [Methylobacter svalbardensis]|uniref:flagellar protein FlaG n=1 Tax=Methylobacter svalbardensis TaxID=3080016 RepID=UPI0030EC63DD